MCPPPNGNIEICIFVSLKLFMIYFSNLFIFFLLFLYDFYHEITIISDMDNFIISLLNSQLFLFSKKVLQYSS